MRRPPEGVEGLGELIRMRAQRPGATGCERYESLNPTPVVTV
ncbi:hypothetical protein BH24CHL3_BH24CHL3_04510 [soil metagenome]